MKKVSKIITLAVAALLSFSVMAGCGDPVVPPSTTEFNGVTFAGDPFLDSVKDSSATLNMAVMFDDKSNIMYNANDTWTGADGTQFKPSSESPMLKAVWKELGERLNVGFNNKSSGFPTLEAQWNAAYGASFSGYDILNASSVNINTYGEKDGSFVNLEPFLNRMPNLKGFLDSNKFVKDAIVSGSGKMFYAPYFDGYDDIERMFIMRADWVRKLLDGAAGEGDTDSITMKTYTPFLPSSLEAISVTVTAKNGTATESLNKLAATNIITQMNALPSQTGKTLLDTFKSYIGARYGNYYGSTPSDLFVGQNAAYDADELVAMLRIVKANSKFLSGVTSDKMIPFYPRSYSNDRTADVMRLAQIFGVRGLDVPNGYFFIGEDGKVTDARVQDDTYYGIEKLNEMYREGLILEDFTSAGTLGTYGNWAGAFNDKDWRGYLNSENRGFMTYDYNQTTTLLNGLNGEVSQTGPNATGNKVIQGFELTPVLPPFTVWKGKSYEGNNKTLTLPALSASNFYRFTESWRTVKPDGWTISSKLSGKSLEKALAMFDYMYSAEGNKLMSFGPDAWIANDNTDPGGGAESKAEGTITYLDREVPKLATQAFVELKNLAYGNYTNYYRQYLGGAMPIGYIKDQGMEYQMTHVKGREGQDKINCAVLTGTLKHAIADGSYYTVQDKSMRTVPATFAFNKSEESAVRENFIKLNESYKLTAGSMAGENLFYKYIIKGFGTETSGDPEVNRFTRKALRDYAAMKSPSFNCDGLLVLVNNAYNRMFKGI